jgi:hypothetical protein
MMMSDREQAIRERAHEIWEDEGRPNGKHLAHWLRAETEIRNELQGLSRPDGEKTGAEGKQVINLGHSRPQMMSNARFRAKREAERRLLQAAVPGGQAYCSPKGIDLSAREKDHPEGTDRWEKDPGVRAALLRWLGVNPAARSPTSNTDSWRRDKALNWRAPGARRAATVDVVDKTLNDMIDALFRGIVFIILNFLTSAGRLMVAPGRGCIILARRLYAKDVQQVKPFVFLFISLFITASVPMLLDPTWTAGPVFAVGNGGNAEGW